MTGGQTFLACALVNAGTGIAVADELVVGSLPRNLVVKPFLPQRVVRLYALSRPERLSLAAQALLRALSEGASGATAGGPTSPQRIPKWEAARR